MIMMIILGYTLWPKLNVNNKGWIEFHFKRYVSLELRELDIESCCLSMGEDSPDSSTWGVDSPMRDTQPMYFHKMRHQFPYDM